MCPGLTGPRHPPKMRRFPTRHRPLKLEPLYRLIGQDMQSVDAVIRARLHSEVALVR